MLREPVISKYQKVWHQDRKLLNIKTKAAPSRADTEAIIEDTLDTRQELDTALHNHYRNNPAKLAEWLTARYIERRRKKIRRRKARFFCRIKDKIVFTENVICVNSHSTHIGLKV